MRGSVWQPGESLSIGEFAHALGVVDVHVGVHRAADAAGQAIEAEPLACLDGELVEVALLGRDGVR